MNPNRYWAKNIFPRSQTCLGLFCANLPTAVKRHFTRFSTPRLRPPVRGFTSGPLVRNRSAPSTVQWPFFGPCLKGAETIPARIPEANPSRPTGAGLGAAARRPAIADWPHGAHRCPRTDRAARGPYRYSHSCFSRTRSSPRPDGRGSLRECGLASPPRLPMQAQIRWTCWPMARRRSQTKGPEVKPRTGGRRRPHVLRTPPQKKSG